MEEGNSRKEMRGEKRLGVNARRVVFLIAALALIISVVALCHRAAPDPIYKGKRLSAYLNAALLPPRFSTLPVAQLPAILNQRNEKLKEARVVAAALGPEAIPLLGEWLMKPRFAGWVQGWLQRATSHPKLRWLRPEWLNSDRRTVALIVARAVAEHCVPLIPMLREQLSDGDRTAALLFEEMLNSLPVEESRRIVRANSELIEWYSADPFGDKTGLLSALVRYYPREEAEIMIRGIFPFRTPNNSVLQTASSLDPEGAILNRLFLEDGSPKEKFDAAIFFRDKPRQADRVVPLLAANLDCAASANLIQNVCGALAAYGTNAASALPLLTNLLACRKPEVVEAAGNAIARINAAVANDE